MPNTSASGGYLTPAVPTPPEADDALAAVFQALVVGITGLTGDLVRPRWQVVVPKMPERAVTWCAIGVTVETPDAGPALEHDAAGLGVDTLARHELIEVNASFYGPTSGQVAGQLRDGLTIPQNIEVLRAQGFAFRDSLPIVSVPEQINNTWFKRYDLVLFFRRKVTRTYGVQNLLAARGVLVTDTTPPISRPIAVGPLP